MKESSLTRSIMRAIQREHPGCVVRKLHGSQFATVGDPDIYGCINGKSFAIEIKTPSNNPRKIQLVRLAEWAASGAVTGCAHSVEEALGILEECKNETD